MNIFFEFKKKYVKVSYQLTNNTDIIHKVIQNRNTEFLLQLDLNVSSKNFQDLLTITSDTSMQWQPYIFRFILFFFKLSLEKILVLYQMMIMRFVKKKWKQLMICSE